MFLFKRVCLDILKKLDVLSSKELGTNGLELQCVMLANHNQNI